MSEHEEPQTGFGGVAMFDQRQAEAKGRLLSNKYGFVLFTIDEADDETLRMKYVGSMDDRLAPTMLVAIMETAQEALRGYVQDDSGPYDQEDDE